MAKTRYLPALLLVLVASAAGFVFAAVSTHDAMLHLDRQIHGIHCSYLLGIGNADASGESGCYATMMSPYSSVFRHTIWGGIPVALPGMALFAFIAFFAAWMLSTRRVEDSRAALFLVSATAVPVLTSLVMGYLSLVTLDAVCKVCVGIYVSAAVAFAGAVYILFKTRKGTRPPSEVSWPALARFAGLGGLFVAIPVVAYGAAAPDFSKYVGNCGGLDSSTDPQGALQPVGPQDSALEMIEVMDPLCAACGSFEQRFRAMPESARLKRKLLLFPLDNTCNWMLDAPIHPGACAVSEAVLCAESDAAAVLDFAIAHRERIMAAAKQDPAAAAAMMSAAFPALGKCIGSAAARAKLNRALRFAVKNRLQVLTPQVYVAGQRLCDADTDLGLEYALSRLIDRAGAMPPRSESVPLEAPPAETPPPRRAPPKPKRAATRAPAEKPPTPPVNDGPADVPVTPTSPTPDPITSTDPATAAVPPPEDGVSSSKEAASPLPAVKAPLSPLPTKAPPTVVELPRPKTDAPPAPAPPDETSEKKEVQP